MTEKSRRRVVPQVVTEITNKVTQQFFISFNNIDCPKKGLARIVPNYRAVIKKLDVEKSKLTAVDFRTINHVFDDGMFWALYNSDLDDWEEQQSKDTCTLKQAFGIQKDLAEKYEKKGFTNVRVKPPKSPEKIRYDSYGWGTFKVNKTLQQWKTFFARKAKAMNIDIPESLAVKVWNETAKPNSLIKDYYDVFIMLEANGFLFRHVDEDCAE